MNGNRCNPHDLVAVSVFVRALAFEVVAVFLDVFFILILFVFSKPAEADVLCKCLLSYVCTT